MTRKIRISVVAVAAAAVAAVATAQQRGQTTPTPRATPAPVVLIGCVERVMPTGQTGTSAAPAAPPAYKIMDVQPGTGAGQKPMTPAAEYLLAGPESIPFSKYQNQWVEVMGTITAAPPTPTPAPSARGQKPARPPLPTFTVTALKVVSTECKQGSMK